MELYLAALVIAAAAVLLGQAGLTLCGHDSWSWLSGAVGLALLLILSAAAAKAPGHASTAVVVDGVAVLLSGLVLLRRGPRLRVPAWEGVAAVMAAALLTAVPFVATGRTGLPGMTLNNDTAVHLIWAESLLSPLMNSLYGVPAGYPLGPHSLIAAVSSLTTLDADAVMTALIVVTPVITVLAGLAAFATAPRLLRAPAAVLTGFSYLLVAWFAQGAFKESLHAMFVLALAIGLGEVLAAPRAARVRMAIPLGLLVAGDIQTYSYLALAWHASTLGIAAALAAVVRLRRPRALAADVRGWVAPVVAGVAAMLVAIAPEIPRIVSYFRQLGASPADSATGISTSNIGNLAGPLPLKEALGVWPIADFRFPPLAGQIVAQQQVQLLAVVLVAVGVVWLVWRREPALPAALLGALAVYLASNGRQSAYVTAKALVVLAPLVTVVSLRPLLDATGLRGRAAVASWVPRLVLAVVLAAATAWSTSLVLRATPVESTPQRAQLDALRPLLRTGRTLFLGVDDYAAWRLRGVRAAYGGVGTPSALPLEIDTHKPYTYGQPLDFDSVPSSALDRFRFVVTVRSPMASAPPPNFRSVRRTALYEVWERHGHTAPRVPAEHDGTAPGLVLSCRRRGSRPRTGTAVSWVAPPVLTTPAPSGLPPGAAGSAAVTLQPGTWDIALQYTSPVRLRVQMGHRKWLLPANTTRPGPWWPAARIRVRRSGKVYFLLIPERESRLTSPADYASMTGLAAVRAAPDRTLPARRACGRYVDHFLLARG